MPSTLYCNCIAHVSRRRLLYFTIRKCFVICNILTLFTVGCLTAQRLKAMAWEISITAEGWQDIYDALHSDKWNVNALSNALADDDFEDAEHNSDNPIEPTQEYWDKQKAKYSALPKDVLADEAYSRVERNNTCDNGAFNYWIDRQGYHKVELD